MISESVVNHSPRTENQSVCSPISGPQQRGGSRPARIFYNQDVRNSAMTISDYMIHHVMESEHTGPNDPKDLIDVDQNYSSCLKLATPAMSALDRKVAFAERLKQLRVEEELKVELQLKGFETFGSLAFAVSTTPQQVTDTALGMAIEGDSKGVESVSDFMHQETCG